MVSSDSPKHEHFVPGGPKLTYGLSENGILRPMVGTLEHMTVPCPNETSQRKLTTLLCRAPVSLKRHEMEHHWERRMVCDGLDRERVRPES
jgi:hypothetical protein